QACCHAFLCFFVTVARIALYYTLSLHDALPICRHVALRFALGGFRTWPFVRGGATLRVEPDVRLLSISSEALRRAALDGAGVALDRKRTRLNSSHVKISYAVFSLKNKKTW